MPTVRLVPSTYYLSSSSYLSVSNADRMYNNTDNTNYATVYNSRTSTTSYYIYLRGFNFSAVPSDAIVSSFTVKLKAYESGVSTSSSYVPYLANGTTTISGSTTAITTTASVHTFTGVTADWDTIKGYGSNFGIRINCRRASRNTAGYMYIYGAEIEVTYTVPVYHNVTVNGESGKVDPTGTESILEGSDYEVRMYYTTKPTVTDNNVNVTSSVTEASSDTITLIPDSYTNSGFTVANIDNAYTDADGSEYASFELSGGGSTGTVYLNLEALNLPSGSTVTSISCQATVQYNQNGSSSGYTASMQLYSGNTAKGSSTSIVTAGGTDVAKTKFTLTTGSWTASELANARLQITATNNARSTHRFLYVYGVSLNVTYTVSGKIYVYTLTNIVTDHVIVVTASAPVDIDTLYLKVSGSWVEVAEAYKKVNGSWVIQDKTTAFDTQTNYVKGETL